MGGAGTGNSILIGAGLLWLIAASIYARVPAPDGKTAGGRNAMEALGKLTILATDPPFRRFVITRALLMCSALSAPFYVALAQSNQGSMIAVLGTFVAAAGLAPLISNAGVIGLLASMGLVGAGLGTTLPDTNR